MLLLVSRTEALLTGIATPRRHGAVSVQANLLTAVYADPLQLERFFVKVPSLPLIIFAHRLKLERA